MRYSKEIIRKYDKNNDLIYRKFSDNSELWYKNNKLIHYKHYDDSEYWYKYNENNCQIIITEKEYKEIQKRNCFTRFDIMDI